MRLDVSYNMCSKLGSKHFFQQNYGNFSFTNPFLDFDCIFPIVILFKVGPDRIYAHPPLPVHEASLAQQNVVPGVGQLWVSTYHRIVQNKQ